MFTPYGFYDITGIIFFAFVLGAIIFIIVRATMRNIKNDRSPLLTVNATVVAKREDMTGRTARHPDSMGIWYYITFELESHERVEFFVPAQYCGQFEEGDVGLLSFQGDRFIKFERGIGSI